MKDLHLQKQDPQWFLVPTVLSFLLKPTGLCVCSKEPEARCLHFTLSPAHLHCFPQEMPCQCFLCPRHTARFFLKEMLDWSSRILVFMLPVPICAGTAEQKVVFLFFFPQVVKGKNKIKTKSFFVERCIQKSPAYPAQQILLFCKITSRK